MTNDVEFDAFPSLVDDARSSQSAIVPWGMARCSMLNRRWNSGIGGFQIRSRGVVGGDAADGAVPLPDAGDDGGEDVGEFRADHEQPFGVGLRRRYLQQRHEHAGAGQRVLDQAVVGQFAST